MKAFTPVALEQAIANQFPPGAANWDQATDEVRDMCRWVRKLAGVSAEQAIDFGSLATPAQWNSQGIAGIIKFYKMMNEEKRLEFCTKYLLI